MRLTASGDVDTAYYIAKAKEQRGEAFATAFKSLKAVVKKVLRSPRSNRLTVPTYTY